MVKNNRKDCMSSLDKMLDNNMDTLKRMQKKMLDMQEEIYAENGEQIERLNKKSAELSAAGTKVHYKAAASGLKEGLDDEPKKYCHECGKEINASAKFCSECGTKQK
ncbi:zinc-ribbon domain-containing protein [Candidatus Saccharibacteria bacterium]|nr:zinc-ribbon domain-containing protein [Candidatus Saccharibacteria bacterium]